MQLSKFTDYALRVLMHLAAAEGQQMTTRQIAEMHDARYNHLAKVTQWLVKDGCVTANRGRSGGILLAKAPEEINIGVLVRKLESQYALVECLRPDGGTCKLTPECGLSNALIIAQDAFFTALEEVTLADLTTKNPGMPQLLGQLLHDSQLN